MTPHWLSLAKRPASILCVLGLLLVAAMARPLLVYPKRVRALSGSDGTRIELLVTHEVSCFECLTLGLASRSYSGYGLSVRLARPDGTTQVVEALSDVLSGEADVRPTTVDFGENGRLAITAPGGNATVDTHTGKLVEEP